MKLSDVQKPLGLACLVSIMSLAFFCRLMSNIRYETVIHEFDPYFQYKSTLKLISDGDEEFSDWLDDQTWYPLSRYMLPTLYPGLMYTARIFIQVCRFIRLPISELQACAYMGPIMSIIGALFSYDFGRMVDDSSQTRELSGIIAALLFSIIPGFIQRSVAGSYDNESNSITAMVAAFDLWLRACGCAAKGYIPIPAGPPALIAAIALLYMALSWGGFVFVICLVPLHVFVCMLSGNMNKRIKVAYLLWMPVSYLLINLVWREYGFVFKQSIALPGIGVFCLLIQSEILGQINKLLPPQSRKIFKKYYISLVVLAALAAIPVLAQIGLLSKITGRFLSFLSPTHARKHNPLVASVSEHQPTVWTSFYFNTWMLPILLPVGYYYGIAVRPSTGSLFMCIYLTTTTWFSAVMSRMILMASPAAAACGGYVVSKILQTVTSVNAKNEFPHILSYRELKRAQRHGQNYENKEIDGNQSQLSQFVVNEHITQFTKILIILAASSFILTFLGTFTHHSLYAAKYYYSNPSVVMIGGQDAQGRPRYIDDFRETYRWLQHATAPTANVASWWDYMYQLNQMSARTTFVDNNTRSPYWIGLMGAILSSNEHVAWRISQDLGVDYVMAVSGAASGFNGDDIGKFMWPVRISSNNRFWERQGYEYFKQYNEYNYYSNGHYLLNEQASYAMKNSMMYKFVYSGLVENTGNTYDHAHRSRIDVAYADRMSLFQEAYSSERMIVRIYKVRDPYNF